jgi:hypothetical protein
LEVPADFPSIFSDDAEEDEPGILVDVSDNSIKDDSLEASLLASANISDALSTTSLSSTTVTVGRTLTEMEDIRTKGFNNSTINGSTSASVDFSGEINFLRGN